jgi:hypothetical protein
MRKGSFLPVCGVGMAQTALARKMGFWHVFNVASFAGGDANMIKLVGFPILNQVTVGTFAFKVVSRRLVTFAAYCGAAGIVGGGVAGFTGDVMASR